MGTIRLEVVPWLTEVFGADRARRLIVEAQVAEGEKVADLLGRLSAEHPRLKELVFDPERGELKGYANIFVNEGRMNSPADLQLALKEGDTVVLLPAYVGGA